MGLNLVKVDAPKGGGNYEDFGGFVSTKTLSDYPVVVFRIRAYGTKKAYQSELLNDKIQVDIVALDAKGKVVYKDRNASWEFPRYLDEKTGERLERPLFKVFKGQPTNTVLAGRIFMPEGKRSWSWENVDLTDAQIKAAEDGLGPEWAGGQSQTKTEGWANKGEELPDFLR